MMKWALRAFLVLFVAWLAATIVLFVVPHGDKPIHADAVVVLSGASSRLPVGLKLVKEGDAPLLVVSRADPGDASPLERTVCAKRVDVRVLCFHAHPYSTVGEAEAVGRMAVARHWTAVDVVTSSYHVVRARILMRRCFHGRLAVVGVHARLTLLARAAALEGVKLVYHEVIHRAC
jgi:uncharacterized SAM-binding protein YcdF (DUF218 family)